MSDYSFEGPKWSSSTITWSFAAAGSAFSSSIAGDYQNIVRAAITRWAQVTNLTFREVPDDAAVDIRVGWSKFSGAQLGQTTYTPTTGVGEGQQFKVGTTIALEDPSARPVGTSLAATYQGTATTLYQTMLHEFGHALGLDHSTNSAAIMYASIGTNDPDLGSADIAGIQLLYGTPAGGAGTPVPMTAAQVAVVAAPASPLAVYRFFDTSTGTQFLTASAAERDTVRTTRPDLTYEGIGLNGIAAGTDPNAAPVYRFFDTKTGTHFFTASTSEETTLAATRPDFVLEEASFYEHATAQAGDAPIFRFFEKTDGTHFYTASAGERATLVATRPDMTFEGVAFYAPMVS